MAASLNMKKPEYIVISLGGSLIVPHLSDEGGVDVQFLKRFRRFLLGELLRSRRFIVVTGGGKVARAYQKAASQISKVSADDLDWVGIAGTKLNAQLLLSVFRTEAYPHVIDRKPSAQELQMLKKSKKNLYIVSGWYPGQSTDFEAVWLAREFGATEVINASNIAFTYDKDPKKYKDAKPIREVSWKGYRKLIPQKWTPGLSSPFDPTAAKEAERVGLKVKILNGSDFKNFKLAIDGKEFTGTIIY